MNFERGKDPKRSMKIGIVTWNNLSSGCILKSKKWVPLVSREDGSSRFASDKAKSTHHIGIDILIIQAVERKRSTIRIEWKSDKALSGSSILEGSIERFRKYFNIVQER
jgi:hypothetical protein